MHGVRGVGDQALSGFRKGWPGRGIPALTRQTRETPASRAPSPERPAAVRKNQARAAKKEQSRVQGERRRDGEERRGHEADRRGPARERGGQSDPER